MVGFIKLDPMAILTLLMMLPAAGIGRYLRRGGDRVMVRSDLMRLT